MNKRLSVRIALALCFALLLQLMAGPIGSLLPAVHAAEADDGYLYKENFDKYTTSTPLSTTAVDGWVVNGSGVTANIADGKLNFSHTGSTPGIVRLDIEGSDEWSNYTVEMDWYYTSSSKYYAGITYNCVNSDNLQKAGLDIHQGKTIHTLNGRLNGSWVNDNNNTKAATDKADLTQVANYRYKVETWGNDGKNEGWTRFSVAPYDAEGNLGQWVEIKTISEVHSKTWQGTIGVFGNNSVTVSVDNIEVYQTVIYEEDFDDYTEKVDLVAGQTVEGWTYTKNGASSAANISGGKLNVTQGAASYDYLLLDGYDIYGNFQVEADISFLTGIDGAPGSSNPGTWMGLMYYASVTDGKWTFLKGSPTTNCGYWCNGQVNSQWKYDTEGIYKDFSLAHDITMGSTFRLRIVVEDGVATHYYAMVDATGKVGEFKQLWQIDVPGDYTSGSIGFLVGRNAATYAVDNIKVTAMKGTEYIPPEARVANIFRPTTGITNAPVAVQLVTEALPDMTKDLPAIALMSIDADLNILDEGGEPISTVADFYKDYSKSVIAGWILDTEAETDALISYLKQAQILDVYVVGDYSDLTYFEYKEGSGVYTATCLGTQLVEKVFKAIPTVRGAQLFDGSLLKADLNKDSKVDYDDLAVLCNMITDDTGVSQLIFNSRISVDNMSYFNNHAVGAWSLAMNAADVYSGIAAGSHAIVALDPAIIYDVYESITTTTNSGRPLPITHRGAHMYYGAETETVTGVDGVEFSFNGECENTIAAFEASWNYFGIMGSELDLRLTKACDPATCTHTCTDHATCKLCQPTIVINHDGNLKATTNVEQVYPDRQNSDTTAFTMWELKQLTAHGRNNKSHTKTLTLCTMEEALAATENLANGNYVYYCHINHWKTADAFNALLEEHPEYIDNCVIFEEPGEIKYANGYNIAYLTAPVPITYATDGYTQAGIMQAGISELEALERVIELFNPNMGSSLIYSYYDFTDGDDSFYYQIAARGVVSYHSVTYNNDLMKRHILNEGSEGCLIEQPRLVDDWFYVVDAPATMELEAGEPLDLTHTVRTINGDRRAEDNIADGVCGFTQISGPKLAYDKTLDGYTATGSGTAEIVFYYDGTADGATYRVYSEPVTVTITADPNGIYLSQNTAELEVAQTVTLEATVMPVFADDKTVTWTSSDDTVAKVSADGTVTAIAKGEAIITATTVNGLTDTCTVTVSGVSEEAQAVIDAIASIGEVDLNSETAIDAARTAYEALNALQKAQVGNYSELLSAEQAYVEALKDAVGADNLEALKKAEEELAAAEKAFNDAREKAIAAEAAAKEANEQAAIAENKALEYAADAAASAEEKARAEAAAAEAKKQAEEANAEAEAAKAEAEAAEKQAADAKAALAKAQADAEAALKNAEEAEAAAALAQAKYDAIIVAHVLADKLEAEGLTAGQASRLAAAVKELDKAIDSAKTVEEVEAALAEGEKALAEAVATESKLKFEDVVEGSWYYDSVVYMVNEGYMNGVSDTLFDIEGEVTRGQLVTMLYRIAGSPSVEGLANPFTDVAEGAFYTEAVIWASKEGVVKGVSDTEFAPAQALTREQFATMLYRWAKGEAVEGALKDFADADAVSAFAADAMSWAVAEGLINGVTADTLDPAGTTLRIQAAVILTRHLT